MAPASVVGSRTRSKKRSQALSLAKEEESAAEFDSVLNDNKETHQQNEFVPLFKFAPDLKIYKRKRNTKSVNKTCEKDGLSEGANADNLDKNKELEEVMPAPKKRNCRTKTKKNIECDDVEKDNDKKPKKRKTGHKNSECNSKFSADYKEIINKKCFVEIQECDKLNKNFNLTEKIDCNDKKVQMNNLGLKTITSSEALNEENEDMNGNIIEKNVAMNIELAIDHNCAHINDNYHSNDDDKSNSEVTKPAVDTSVPTTTNCLEMRKEKSFHNNLTEDNSAKRKILNHNSDNHITVPCICNTRVQCFGPYSEGSYASRRMIGNGVEILKSLKHEKMIMAGFIKIQSHSFISGKATNNTVYFVVEGKLNVNIAGNKKKVGVDDAFMIIQGTEYEIKNLEKEPARLSFVKSRLL